MTKSISLLTVHSLSEKGFLLVFTVFAFLLFVLAFFSVSMLVCKLNKSDVTQFLNMPNKKMVTIFAIGGVFIGCCAFYFHIDIQKHLVEQDSITVIHHYAMDSISDDSILLSNTHGTSYTLSLDNKRMGFHYTYSNSCSLSPNKTLLYSVEEEDTDSSYLEKIFCVTPSVTDKSYFGVTIKESNNSTKFVLHASTEDYQQLNTY